MKKIISILIIAFLFSCQSRIDTNKSDSDKTNIINSLDSLTGELTKIYNRGFINGFSVAIVDDSQTIYQRGFGYSDINNQQKYSEHTVQNIASISKTFLGIALLKAQEMGKLKLDDPVNKYLPFNVINPYYPEEKISIRHLATHTSTIKDTEFYRNKAYVLKNKANESIEKQELYVKFNSSESHSTIQKYLEKVLKKNGQWYKKDGFLNNKPGEIFEYSNVGATLAALVLEMATGEPYDEFTTKHIIEPLKMTSTGWSFEDIDMSKHSKLYFNKNTEIPFYSLITFPDGGLLTSANDLSKYLSELIKGFNGEGKLLNKESYKEFFTKQLTSENFPYDSEENEGIFVSFASNGYIGHSGGDPGVTTFMFFDPNNETGIILFANTQLNNKGQKEYDDIIYKLIKYAKKMNK